MTGLAYMYAELKDDMSAEVISWLSNFLDSLKVDRDSIAFTDKIKAALMMQVAIWKAEQGYYEESEKYIRNAYLLAAKFDSKPVYNLKGIKFIQGEEEKATVYDDIGETAMKAVKDIVFNESEETEGHKFVQTVWNDLTKELEGQV
ncbi:MAG: hypothetical protein GX213_00175 [Clostridiaceae bacterium]|nr:hypothetical protein [Clostridiaceae bacterium]